MICAQHKRFGIPSKFSGLRGSAISCIDMDDPICRVRLYTSYMTKASYRDGRTEASGHELFITWEIQIVSSSKYRVSRIWHGNLNDDELRRFRVRFGVLLWLQERISQKRIWEPRCANQCSLTVGPSLSHLPLILRALASGNGWNSLVGTCSSSRLAT